MDAATFDNAVLCVAELLRDIKNALALEKFHTYFLVSANKKNWELAIQWSPARWIILFAMANASLVDGWSAPLLPPDGDMSDSSTATVEQSALFRCCTLPMKYARSKHIQEGKCPLQWVQVSAHIMSQWLLLWTMKLRSCDDEGYDSGT